MKKLILMLVMIAGFMTVTSETKAQEGSAYPYPLTAGDTLITSASKDSVTKSFTLTASYASLGIQVTTTKVSGTVVGKAYLYRSNDGVNYVVTDSSAAFLNQTTNVAQFEKADPSFQYYRIQVREPDGAVNTQSNIVRFYLTTRPYERRR
jgi:hypothetical protein